MRWPSPSSRPLAGYSLPPPSPKGGRLRLINFPIEKIIIARPRVDLAPANLTSEISRLLVCMLISCRGVRHPAIGTAKIFGRPNVACHPAIMRRTEHVFQPGSLPQSMTSYSNPKIRRLSDSVFLTPQILGHALNAGYRFLEVRCLGCDTHQTVALDIVRRPKTTPIHELERYMRCRGLLAGPWLPI